ncbi:MAG: metallophosphoesterase [Kiritimatiellae bacterium]|nr:metallophosphoesterase [Kiritimatiellia bacterium]
MMNRRQFLLATSAGAAAWAIGWPQRSSWAAAPDAPRESLRIAFFTDIHTRVEWETPEALRLTARLINERKPDLVICGGDCITDGFQNGRDVVAPRWKAFRESLFELVEPTTEVAMGNHDIVGAMPEDGSAPEADPRSMFREELGIKEIYRSFDAGGYHVILLDGVQITRDEVKYRGFIDDEQMKWLRDDVSRVDATTPIILVTHMPLLSSFQAATLGNDVPAPRNRAIVNNREVLEVFKRHHLPLVLQGHNHVNELLRWRDTTFITGGAVCAKWWRGPWFGTEEGFGVVTLRKENVDWEYVDIGWTARRPPNQ